MPLEDVSVLHYDLRPVVLSPWEQAALALLNTGWMPFSSALEAAGEQPWAEHLFALLTQLNFYGLIDMEIRSSYTEGIDRRLYHGSRHSFRLICPAPEAADFKEQL